ncbi:hypothetical protein CLU81_0931 [Flavobacterium sp. 9]|uniref:beta strand repeat-containing protein n=1 Tax=Flavobacterium sp. 9 TaxID=2035198 RepID=UPI000C19B169|nr:hypothetical protein [Flavobacterium sp. 9]PIF30501.1 hypothetical protein CLU81_0931 [Flavobacterium sp. 9]
MKNKLLSVLLFLGSYTAYSQVGIGTPVPNSSSQLEVVATDKGVLIPRINLTSSTDVTTIKNGNINSLLVFNTVSISDITPGYYYWYNNKWNRIVISSEISQSPGTVIYNPVNQQFTYIDSSGNSQILDFNSIVKTNETITTLVSNIDGSYTYTNEAGMAVNIDVIGDVTTNFTTIANNPAVTNIIENIVNKTKGIVTFNSSTNQFSYVDASGTTQVIDISTVVKANETLTTLVNNGAGSYTYTNEAGTAVNIDVVGDVTTNFTTIANDPAVTNIIQNIVNKTEGNVTFDAATNQFSYVDASGNTQLVDISTIVKANETLTTLVNNGAGSYTYTNEAGTAVNIDVVGDVTTNFTTIANDPAVTNIIQNIVNKTEGNVTFDATTNQFSYVDASGNTQLVDISTIVKANETLTTLVNNGAGSYTYTNEAGTAVNIDIVGDVTTNFTTIANDPAVTNIIENIVNKTEGNVTFDATTNQFSYVDASGNTQLVDISTIIKANETITTLDKDASNNGKYIYTSENSTQTTIDVVGDVINNSSTILTNPAFITELTNVIKANETITTQSQDLGTGTITYTNEAGAAVTAQVVSTDTGNLVKVGTDGGAFLNAGALPVTTVANNSTANALNTTVNGLTGADVNIINSNTLEAVNGNLVSTVNGVATTPSIPVLISADNALTVTNGNAQLGGTLIIPTTITTDATNTLAVAGLQTGTSSDNIVVADASGVLKTVTPGSLIPVTTVSNTSTINSLSTTVNGVTGTDVPIINSNAASLTGASLTTTVNGITSTALDLTPAIAAGQTITNLTQDPASGVISYTNENAVDQIAVVTSTDPGNVLTVGTDGGSLLTPAAITSATTVSNASATNTATVTVNGVTSTGAPIVNSNEVSLAGSSLTTTVNGVASTSLDLTPAIAAATTVSNSSASNSLTTTVNGITGTAVDIINSNVLSTTGNTLTSTINGEPSNAIDLTSVIAAGETTTNLTQDISTGLITYTNEDSVDQTAVVTSTDAGNIMTVGTDGGGFVNAATIKANETITTITPIINSGSTIATYTNEAGGTPVDIQQTVTKLSQDLGTGIITFTNEDGLVTNSQVVSTDVGNIVTVGTDGGGFVNAAIIKANETITTITPIITSGSTIATYTNEAGGTPIEIKETVTSLKDIVTDATDPFGNVFDLHTLTYTDETNTPYPIDMKVLVKGVETLTSLNYDGAAHSLIYNDEAGNATEFKMVDLIGDAETLTTLAVNATTSTLDYTDEHKVVTQLDLGAAVKEPWYSTTTHIGATLNTEDVYMSGWVGIGFTAPSTAPNEKLRVNGAISTVNNYYADYVFEDYFKGFSTIKSDYKFKSLPEIEAFIKKNKHLPGITPINELEKTKEGYSFNMSELSIQLLEKTEELYLYTIEQNKINEAQNKEIEAKEKEIKELKEASRVMNLRLERLEKLIAEKDN